ncbi:hypothetical protein [Amycolatopsis sp. YIM 10]|uniref:CBU_0592 family membrane protein n=1 Tax=Amycolatopsis sp. YIM 10 TaxID=2653857 RepID=UPI00128FD0C2|nr:hypothetical protein [Amycolatopsis sp. YIM 10]
MEELLSLAASAAGWAGTLCTAAAYALVSRQRLSADSTLFQALNVLGGALLAVSAASSGAWPSVTSNVVWVLIGVQAVIGVRRALRKKRGAEEATVPLTPVA